MSLPVCKFTSFFERKTFHWWLEGPMALLIANCLADKTESSPWFWCSVIGSKTVTESAIVGTETDGKQWHYFIGF